MYMSDCMFMNMCCNYRPPGLHPASILQLNGDNAIKGPSGYSTGCRVVTDTGTTKPDDIEVPSCADSFNTSVYVLLLLYEVFRSSCL